MGGTAVSIPANASAEGSAARTLPCSGSDQSLAPTESGPASGSRCCRTVGGVKIDPGAAPETQRQVVEQSLGDEALPNVPLVSGEFAANVLPVTRRLALHILLTAAAVDEIHVPLPEVIRVGPDGVNGLFEVDFNFDTPAVEANHLQRVQGQIGVGEDHVPASGVPAQTKRTN